MDGQRESLFHATAPGVSDRLPKKRILDKSRDDLKPLLARRRQIAVHSVVDDVTVDPDSVLIGQTDFDEALGRGLEPAKAPGTLPLPL